MPYIIPERRRIFDESIDKLVLLMRQSCVTDGDINYILTRIGLGSTEPKEGWGYHSISEIQKVYNNIADEIGRRLLASYENLAGLRSGDVKEFANATYKGLKSPFINDVLVDKAGLNEK